MSVLDKESLKRLQKIHEMSFLYNGEKKERHKEKLLLLMQKHIEEICELEKENNSHFLVETGDLIILCFELLIEHNKSIDEILLQCFERYETKLGALLEEA